MVLKQERIAALCFQTISYYKFIIISYHKKSTKHLSLHNEMGIFSFTYTYAPIRICPEEINSVKRVLLLLLF